MTKRKPITQDYASPDFEPSQPPPPPKPPLSLADVEYRLRPLRNILEAAVEIAPAHAITKFIPIIHDIVHGPQDAYRLEMTSALDASVPDDSDPALKKAYKYRCLCGIVCWIFVDAVKQVLSNVVESVDLIWVEPLAKLALVEDSISSAIGPHSLIKITLLSGEELAADWTYGQFGHAPDNWIMPFSDYIDKFVWNKFSSEPYQYINENTLKHREQEAGKILGGYWVAIREYLDSHMLAAWRKLKKKSEEEQRDYLGARFLELRRESLLRAEEGKGLVYTDKH